MESEKKEGIIETYPDKAIYCPLTEDHKGQYPHLLLALSDDAMFARCREHDWLRIEMCSKGQKIDFSNLSVTMTAVKPKTDGAPCAIFYGLQVVPVYAKGDFPLRLKRDLRWGLDQNDRRTCSHK